MKHSLIYRFLNKTLTREELHQLQQQVNRNDEDLLKAIEQDWDTFETPDADWAEAQWMALESQINPMGKKQKRGSVIQLNRWMRVAASLLLIATAWFAIRIYVNQGSISTDETADMVIKTNNSDKARNVMLKDGTKVLLTGHSSLSYYKTFNEKYRVVHLNGEAYFKTDDDNQRPFIVISDKITSICRGNEFAVTAYKNSDEISIFSSSAQIEVAENDKLNSENNKVAVSNCQRYSFSKASQQYLVGQVSDCDFNEKVRSMRKHREDEVIVML
ncbi:MAG: FecR family protein [Cyclobacteriaceae bacterium]|nr:FecR family protein [Cyclobacteriaceae bacterium]